jgi:hypothetical protein
MERHELLAKLPKSKDIILRDPSARAFFEHLAKGVDPIVVIDEMLVHYTGVVTKYQNDLKDYIEQIYGPQDDGSEQ